MEQFQNIRTMLQIAVDIHNWESEHMQELETMSGRFIFLNLVSYFCKDQEHSLDTSPLKSIYRTENISEKSIRNKLKDFHAKGLIQYVTLASDGRSKCAIPTNQMIQRLIVYSEQINYIIRNHYYLVSTENQLKVDSLNTGLIPQQHAQLQKNLKSFIPQRVASKLMDPTIELTRMEKRTILAFQI